MRIVHCNAYLEVLTILASRTPFTNDDDLHLAKYLARRIPYKDSGGRTGQVIYKQLEEQASPFTLRCRFLSSYLNC